MKLGLMLSLVAAPATAEPCDASPKVCGRRAFDAGVKAYQASEYAAARRHFEEAYSIRPHPVVAFNWALAEAKAGALLQAIQRFDSVIADSATPKSVKRTATKEREQAEKDLATLELDVTSEALVASVDGKPLTGNPPATRLDPGPHELNVTRNGKPAMHRQLTLRRGERILIRVDTSREVVVVNKSEPAPPPAPPPPAPSKLSPVWFFVGAGTTLVLGGVSTWSAIDTKMAFDDYERDLPNLDQAEVNRRVNQGQAKETRTNVLLFATGAAGVATAVVGVFFVDWSGKQGQPRVGVALTPSSVNVAGSF